LLQVRLLSQQVFKVRTAEATQLHLGCCFCRIWDCGLEGPPQEIGREQQGDNLLSTVRQGLCELDDSGKNGCTPIFCCRDAGDQLAGRKALAKGPAAETCELLRVQHPTEGALSDSTIKARPSQVNRHSVSPWLIHHMWTQ